MTREEFQLLRNRMGLTQAALANQLGIKTGTVYRYEAGVIKQKNGTLRTVRIPARVEIAMRQLAEEKVTQLIFINSEGEASPVTREFLLARNDWESIAVEGAKIILYIQDGYRTPAPFLNVIKDPITGELEPAPIPGQTLNTPQEDFPTIDPTTWDFK